MNKNNESPYKMVDTRDIDTLEVDEDMSPFVRAFAETIKEACECDDINDKLAHIASYCTHTLAFIAKLYDMKMIEFITKLEKE